MIVLRHWSEKGLTNEGHVGGLFSPQMEQKRLNCAKMSPHSAAIGLVHKANRGDTTDEAGFFSLRQRHHPPAA